MALTTIPTVTTELTLEVPLDSQIHPPCHVSARMTKVSAAVVAVETALAIIKLELGTEEVAIDAGKMTAPRIVIFTEKALEEVSGR